MDGLEVGEYENYWGTQKFFSDVEELGSWGFDDAFSGCYDSSSPDGAASSATTAKKSIAQERERRKRFNDKLYALRSLVPSITKLDKVSIVKDAIDYIMELQQQERKLVAEISEMEQKNGNQKGDIQLLGDASTQTGSRKKRRTSLSSESSTGSPISVTELEVREVGDGTTIVSITCVKKMDTMARLCEALESLHLNILAANITSFSGNILHTLSLEIHDMEGTQLRKKIEAALAGYDL